MMNHGKKLLSLLLAVMMLLGMMQTAAFAGVDVIPSDAVITLTPSTTEALNPGDTFTVIAEVENNPGYISAAFCINFDKTALTATEFTVARGDSFSFGNYATNLNKDYGAFITFAAATADTYDGKLFSMSFKVNDDAQGGSYDISIDKTNPDHLFDYQDAEVNTTFHTWDAAYVPATVTVAGENACDHATTVPSYEHVEGTETHTVTMICANAECGQKIGDVTTENCVDTDPVDGKCDKCGESVTCKHANTTESTEYAVANGTHTLVTKVVCSDCGETISTTNGESAACSDGDQDGLCDVCNSPVGDYADMNVSSDMVTAGDTVQMKISVENDQNAASEFNSYEFVVEYDSANLTYTGKECADDNCAVVENEGQLIINGYGDVKTVSENAFVTLNFVAASVEAETTAVIKLTDAYRDTSAMAIQRDIDQIEVKTTEETITIQPSTVEYNVTFSKPVLVNGEPKDSVKVNAGEKVTFDIIPQTGMKAEVSGEGVNKFDEDTYEVIPEADTEVTITYSPMTYTVEIKDVDDAKTDTATYGKDYEVAVADKANYILDSVTYSIDGGTPVAITKNSDGKYVIPGDAILGNVTITINRTYNDPGVTTKYTVSYYENGKMTNTEQKVSGESVTVQKKGYVIYQVGETKLDAAVETYTFTVSGDISIYMGSKHTVTLPEDKTSEGENVVTGGTDANYGTDYKFTVEEGYEPTVTIGGEPVTPTDNGAGTYTVPGDAITGDIVITVSKIVYAATVDVYPYVKTNGADDGAAVIQLVVATAGADVAEGEILQYNGANMFWSSKYNGYAYLVLVEENEKLLTKETAAANIGKTVVTDKPEVTYNGNVNMTANDVVDINDAQLVYDIYKAMYSDFTKVNMEKMLRADMNANADDVEATYGLTVNDVRAVLALVQPAKSAQ